MADKISTDQVIASAPSVVHPLTNGLVGFLRRNRNPMGAFAMMLLFWGLMLGSNPRVFTNPLAYTSVLTTLPIIILMATALVFMTTSGVIDVSYASTIALGAWGFAVLVRLGYSPFVGLLAAILLGALVGLINSLLILRFRLQSLIATLGMLFFIRGTVNILADGKSIPVPYVHETFFYQVCCGKIGIIPIQIFWGLAFAALTWVLYSWHSFGAHIHIIGDNEESARKMGIPINRVKTFTYVYVGIASAIAGVFIVSILTTFWPNTGDSYLLVILAAIFVGGNPLIGGVGTVVGALIGSFTVGFIETGIIAAGLTDFYTKFTFGVVLILSLLGFRTEKR